MFPRVSKAVLITAVAATASVLLATPAQAEPVSGCETIPWGFLGSERRSICDSVRHADGGWTRARSIVRPAYYRNARSSCYGGYYSSSCTFYEGGWVSEAVIEAPHTYIVFDHNIVPGEPGHLVNGNN